MLSLTFDTNILIDMEEKRHGYEHVLEIVNLHNLGLVNICIPAIIASEKMLDDNHIPDYRLFEEYLANLKIMNYEELMPLAYLDICFFDHAIWADEELSELDILIQKTLFPNIESEYEEYCSTRKLNIEDIHPKWMNAKIDVQILWCHIYYKKDIFITRDENYTSKLKDLNRHIGGIVIMSPSEFMEHFGNHE